MKSNYVAIRLGVAFSLLIGILICTGWLALSRLGNSNAEVQEFTEFECSKIRLAREAVRYSSLNSRINFEIFIVWGQKEVKPLLAERAKNSQKISELLQQIQQKVECAEEQKLLDNVESARAAYVESYKRVTDLWQTHEHGARLLASSETMPLLKAYHGNWEAFAGYQNDEIDKASRIVAANFKSAQRGVLVLLLLGSILAVAIGFFTTRGLMREIAIRQEAEVLRQSQHELEARVQERTAELTRATGESQAMAGRLSIALRELQSSEQRFRTLTTSAPIGIFLTDSYGHCLYTNPHLQSLTGRTMESVLGQGWTHAIFPDAASVPTDIREHEQESANFKREFCFRNTTGEIRWVHCNITILRSENGEIMGRVGIVEDITDRKRAEIALEKAQADLVAASRQAGMAEMATGVLHNVNNILNSVDLSASLIGDRLRKSRASSLARVTALLREHTHDLGTFITQDPKGQQIPAYLETLAKYLEDEQAVILQELKSFAANLGHIKEIVAMQQTTAKLSGNAMAVNLADLVEDSLRINATALARHRIQIIRDFDPHLGEITVEKHKVLQILVNLVRNAKQACEASNAAERKVIVRTSNGDDFARIAVIDNGVGIAPENMARMFTHGFTTKKNGHGFGLHSAAVAAKEMGGALLVQSPGAGQGATFTLQLPRLAA